MTFIKLLAVLALAWIITLGGIGTCPRQAPTEQAPYDEGVYYF